MSGSFCFLFLCTMRMWPFISYYFKYLSRTLSRQDNWIEDLWKIIMNTCALTRLSQTLHCIFLASFFIFWFLSVISHEPILTLVFFFSQLNDCRFLALDNLSNFNNYILHLCVGCEYLCQTNGSYWIIYIRTRLN